jgi:acyl carrier protein
MLTERLAAAFRHGLDLPPHADVTELAFEQHPHWDSLGHMSLVAALEHAFGITLEEEEVLNLSSYRAAVAMLETKGLS